MLSVRDAVAEDVEDLARIWREGWPDARDRLLPPELLRCRMLKSFRTRLNDGRRRTGIAVGFAMMKTDELDELYVTRSTRGTGVATALVVEALHRIR